MISSKKINWGTTYLHDPKNRAQFQMTHPNTSNGGSSVDLFDLNDQAGQVQSSHDISKLQPTSVELSEF